MTPFDVAPYLMLGAIAVLYRRGNVLMRTRSVRWSARRQRESMAFWCGLLVLFAVGSPLLDRWGDGDYGAHMAQHLILMEVACPLLALGSPEARLRRSVPRRWVDAVGLRRAPGSEAVRIWIGWIAMLIVLWAWHAPPLYDAADAHPVVHLLEHASFVTAAYLLWDGVVRAVRRGRAHLAAIVAVATTGLQSGALGALLLFAATPLSHPQSTTASTVSTVDLIARQQLAGLLMWVVAGPVHVVVVVALLASCISSSERRLEVAA